MHAGDTQQGTHSRWIVELECFGAVEKHVQIIVWIAMQLRRCGFAGGADPCVDMRYR